MNELEFAERMLELVEEARESGMSKNDAASCALGFALGLNMGFFDLDPVEMTDLTRKLATTIYEQHQAKRAALNPETQH